MGNKSSHDITAKPDNTLHNEAYGGDQGSRTRKRTSARKRDSTEVIELQTKQAPSKAERDPQIEQRRQAWNTGKAGGDNSVQQQTAATDDDVDFRDVLVKVTLTKQPGIGFGFSFIGPDTAEPAMAGNFITRVRVQNEALAPLRRGHQILSINGTDVVVASKHEVAEMLSSSEKIVMELKYDPQAFATFDKGEEARRSTMIDFVDGVKGDELKKQDEFDVTALGFRQVPSAEPADMQTAFKELNKQKSEHKHVQLALKVNCLVVNNVTDKSGARKSTRRRKGDDQDDQGKEANENDDVLRAHQLVDVVRSQSSGPVLALVVNERLDKLFSDEFTQTKRGLVCFLYRCKTKKEAEALAADISETCRKGFDRMRKSMKRRSLKVAAMEAKQRQAQEALREYEKSAKPKAKDGPATTTASVGDESQEETSPDDELPLNKQHFYTSKSNIDAIEDALKKRGAPTSFIVCPHSRPHTFNLLVKHTKTVSRYVINPNIVQQVIRYQLDNREPTFDDPLKVVRHYQVHPIDKDTSTGKPFTLYSRNKQKQHRAQNKKPATSAAAAGGAGAPRPGGPSSAKHVVFDDQQDRATTNASKASAMPGAVVDDNEEDDIIDLDAVSEQAQPRRARQRKLVIDEDTTTTSVVSASAVARSQPNGSDPHRREHEELLEDEREARRIVAEMERSKQTDKEEEAGDWPAGKGNTTTSSTAIETAVPPSGSASADLKEQEKAAVTIQSAFRGKKARQQAEELRREKEEQEQAAVRIQAAYRGRMARQKAVELREERHQQDAAATKIQAAFRGRKARQQAEELRLLRMIEDDMQNPQPAPEPNLEASELDEDSGPRDEAEESTDKSSSGSVEVGATAASDAVAPATAAEATDQQQTVADEPVAVPTAIELEENEASAQLDDEAKRAAARIEAMKRRRRATAETGTAAEMRKKAQLAREKEEEQARQNEEHEQWLEQLRNKLQNSTEYKQAENAKKALMMHEEELKRWHERKLQEEAELERRAEERRRKLEEEEQRLRREEEERERKRQEEEQAMRERKGTLPKLDRERFRKFATERERMEAEANVEESTKRLSEVNFSFSWS